jgi:membrane-associated protease RseP (regulator of RpoE activity)
MNSPLLTILSFLIIFTVVVVSHEFGHYLLARLNGIRVREFSVGMGPALFRKKGKMTELVIRALPIGGACIFEGEPGEGAELGQVAVHDAEEENREEIRDDLAGKSFNEAPVWGRIASVLAGPLFNILLAFLLGLPANETVLPVLLMAYTATGSLTEPGALGDVRAILLQNGWSAKTALCVLVFTVLHWPCSTTLLTIKKETGGWGWTALAALLPTAFGLALCALIAQI